MKVYIGLETFEHIPNAIVTSGTFDGVHFGHQKILLRLKEIAKNEKGQSVVITYWPHPRFVLFPEQDDMRLLSTLEEKIFLLKDFGIQHLLVVNFTKEFSQLSSLEFVQKILIEKVGIKRLVIGYDHRFGRNREGSFDYLKENAPNFGFTLEEIPKQELQEVAVSSTKIRQALSNHDIKTANKYLTRQYHISGKIVKGRKLGRNIGYPTANIAIEENYKLIPANGIYAVKVAHDGCTYSGMLNIGFRPTIKYLRIKTIEVHIFDFNKEIYAEIITIHFVKYLRSEQKFESLEALKMQLGKDKIEAIRHLIST